MTTTGKVGDETMIRTWIEDSRCRRRCVCCGKRASHIGLGGGVGLILGCEWLVRKWCQDPSSVDALMAPRSGGER